MASNAVTCSKMVLYDVTNGTDLFVKTATTLYAESLGHGDLHGVDEIPVPDRLEEGVGKPEVEKVLHCLLAEIVVDAEDGGLREILRARCG